MYFTGSIGNTWRNGCARIHTTISSTFLVTHFMGGAVGINSTILLLDNWFWYESTAINVWIPCVSFSTSANASMIASFAVCIGSTITGIYALLISTS